MKIAFTIIGAIFLIFDIVMMYCCIIAADDDRW